MDHILVGIDGTDAGDAALRWSLAEAAARDVDLVAVHAWRPPVETEFSWAEPSFKTESDSVIHAELVIEEALLRVAGSTPSAAGGPSPSKLRMVVLPGPAALVLEEQARSAALLVLGRRHETAASRAMHGSVVSSALHHVDCPVVIVPRGYAAAAVTDQPPGRVVVGLASDEASNGALAWAAKTASLHHRTLVPLLVRPPGGAPQPSSASTTALDAAGLRHLTRHVQSVAPEFCGSLQPELLVGRPGEELSRFVAPHDLLVLGSRGRRHLVGWFLGSASSYVAQHAPCPVVVVRDKS